MAIDRPHTVRLREAGPVNTQHLTVVSRYTYDRPYLSLDNSEISRVTPVVFFSGHTPVTCLQYDMNTFPVGWTLPPQGPPENARFIKMHHIRHPPWALYKICRGRGLGYTEYFEGSFRLQNWCIVIVLRVYMWPPEGAQCGPMWKFGPPWEPNFGGTPQYERCFQQRS